MQASIQQRIKHLIIIVTTIAAIVTIALPAMAQDTSGEWHQGDDDGRLNLDVTMGGANVYCVDANHGGAFTYAGGGGFLVESPPDHELLFVPESAINDGVQKMTETGQYQLLGESAEAWFNGQPIRMYVLPNGEFQVNASDEWGKTVEFQWRECRNYTITTNDGCRPGYDRASYGTCVHADFY